MSERRARYNRDRTSSTRAPGDAAAVRALEARPYHHGDLRRALVEAAVGAIAADGIAALSLRDLARRVGVSHAAPAHHFGDKAGLLTAVATEGFRRLGARMAEAYEGSGSFLEVGVAYVRFAFDERAFFEVMFRPELYHRDDPDLAAASQAVNSTVSGAIVRSPGASDERTAMTAIGAWALVHGLAMLALEGNLPPDAARDPEALTRAVASALFVRPPIEPPAGQRTEIRQ